MKILKCFLLICLFLISGEITRAQSITWTEVEPGIWKGVIGKPEEFDLLKVAGAQPYRAGLQQMPKATFHLCKMKSQAVYKMAKPISAFHWKKGANIWFWLELSNGISAG
jgi:hypothetical protein